MARTALLAGALLALAGAATACTVTVNGASLLGGTGNPNANASVSYTADQVKAFFDTDINRNTFLSTRPAAISMSCVDSRSEAPLFGTPGGDMAEFIGAIWTYMQMMNDTVVTQAKVDTLLDAFLKEPGFGRTKRFYFHQGDSNLRSIYTNVSAALSLPTPINVFPDTAPTDANTLDTWLVALSEGKWQGCGHIRLMIDQFADYGLPSADLPQFAIRAFYKYWWTKPVGAPERKKINWEILQAGALLQTGPLIGQAVAAVVPTDNSASSCINGRFPAMATSYTGGQLFVYHATLVDTYRKTVFTPFFGKQARAARVPFNATGFDSSLNSFLSGQLTATLTNLSPPKFIQWYAVSITAAPAARG